jgi:peptidoglycan/xylan/chitin deacetylase (PgdA/CDA1 family)
LRYRALLALLGLTLTAVTLGALGFLVVNPTCAALPLRTELLPSFDDTPLAATLPAGWGAAVRGPARLAEYTVGGEGRSLLLIGIGNSLSTPPISVAPGRRYCLVVQALTDRAPAANLGPTRVQARFHWLQASGQPLAEAHSGWLEVKTPEGGGWSLLRAQAQAPEGAAQLRVSFHPASDDPIYLDELHLRQGGAWSVARAQSVTRPDPQRAVTLAPWPGGKRAALSFSFDWETTMGGLIHSRSAGDPNFDQDPVARGLRMRQGVTETLKIFAPYGVRATYYATGYNLLMGNRERRTFMGDPTYSWATPANRWRNDWSQRPWFGDDPFTDHADADSQGAAWYFGDLVALLRAAGQDIQSHTFAHFYGGFVSPQDWQADIAAWQAEAASHGMRGPQSIAFPWSSSGGMSYAAWQVLEQQGIRSVTRLSDQAQYQLFEYVDDVPVAPRCLPVPGHEIVACPDIYLTPGLREQKALQAIDAAIAAEGALDIWTHTEEVVSPEQIATWQRVVSSAAERDELWIAPLDEIAAWQRALGQVQVGALTPGAPYRLEISNHGAGAPLDGVTLRLPFAVRSSQVLEQGRLLAASDTPAGARELVLPPLGAGQIVEVRLWPA